MKKTLLTIMATVCVMTTLFSGVLGSIYKSHAEDLETVASTYEALLEEKDAEMDELEYQIEQIVRGRAYEVSLTHDDGSVHTWRSNGNGTAK